MITKTILSVEKISSGHWCIVHQDSESGNKHAMCFPESIFGYRAAEYGIDYHDFDTLVDVVMYETQFELDAEDPTHLYRVDEATARTAHLERIKKSKDSVNFYDPENHLEKLKEAHYKRYDDSVQSQRKENTRKLREQRMRGTRK